jgi:hypothetical protein
MTFDGCPLVMYIFGYQEKNKIDDSGCNYLLEAKWSSPLTLYICTLLSI